MVVNGAGNVTLARLSAEELAQALEGVRKFERLKARTPARAAVVARAHARERV